MHALLRFMLSLLIGLMCAVIAGLLLATPSPAQAAGFTTADSWTSKDKGGHALAGAAIASAVAAATASDRAGLLAGVAAGMGKELADMHSPGHTPSWKDVAATALGAAAAVQLRGLCITPTGISWSARW